MRINQDPWERARTDEPVGRVPTHWKTTPYFRLLAAATFPLPKPSATKGILGRRHQWSDHLIEELVGIFLLGKGPLQELDKRGSFSASAPSCAPWCSRRFHSVRPLSGADQRLPIELNRLTPPPPAMAMRGSASANLRLNLMGARRSRVKVPTSSRSLSFPRSRCP
jgi:hypothetical protein